MGGVPGEKVGLDETPITMFFHELGIRWKVEHYSCFVIGNDLLYKLYTGAV